LKEFSKIILEALKYLAAGHNWTVAPHLLAIFLEDFFESKEAS
jgi:hypothetical protein